MQIINVNGEIQVINGYQPTIECEDETPPSGGSVMQDD